MNARFALRWLLGWLLFAATQAFAAQILTKSLTRAELVRATETAIASGEFGQHLDFLDGAILDCLKSLQSANAATAADRLLADDVLALAVMQSALLHEVSPEVLAQGAKADAKNAAFLKWLLGDRDALAAFLTTRKPENDPAVVFPLWAKLWNKDPADGAKYCNLALACAVVFDKPLHVKRELDPHGTVEAGERYDYFRNADKQHKLKTDLTKLPAWELVWVVDAPVPTSELEWALKNIHLPRDSWAHAYDMVEYRMAKATQGTQLYDQYTLAEILKKGGICGDRAYFASVTAKAHGIPAIMLVGEGQRGGHAWFAYKATAKWNMSAGRYEGDQYATGYTTDPQTRRSIKEQTLNFLTDGQRRTPEYDKARRLTWLASILLARGQTPQAGSLLEAALAASSRHLAAWDAYFKYLKLTKAAKDRWKSAVQTARSNFRGYPDMLARLDTLETETVLDPANVDDVLKSLHTQVRKLESRSKARSDLILETIERHLKLLRASDEANATQTIYEKTLKEFGNELPVYETLAKKYFAFAREHNLRKKALDAIEAIFRKYYTAPTQDYFEISTRARLLNMIAGFYRADGQDAKADALAKKAADMEKRAAAAHKNDR